MPEEGFSPDADFPAIYAEKGILHFSASFPLKNPPFRSLAAGERVNMVCDDAIAVLTPDAAEKVLGYTPDEGISFDFDKESNTLRVRGKSAHGSTPEKGANALGAMLKFFASFDEDCKNAYDLLFADRCCLKDICPKIGV